MEKKQAVSDHLNSRMCPACKGEKHLGIIVCLDCWSKLRGDTKLALTKADAFAIGRRKVFYRQLDAGITVDKIQIYTISKVGEYQREPIKRRSKPPEEPLFEFYDSIPVKTRARRGR